MPPTRAFAPPSRVEPVTPSEVLGPPASAPREEAAPPTEVDRPPASTALEVTGDERLFPPEGSAEGCASGECLPEPEPEPAQLTSHDVWRRAVEAVRAQSIRFGKSLSFARMVSFEPGLLKIAFPPEAGFHRATVFGSAKPEIEKQISVAIGHAMRLQEDSSNASLAAAPKSIAEQELSDRTAREHSIDARVRIHPAVQNVLKYFGGQVEHVQVLDPLPPAGAENPAPTEDDS